MSITVESLKNAIRKIREDIVVNIYPKHTIRDQNGEAIASTWCRNDNTMII